MVRAAGPFLKVLAKLAFCGFSRSDESIKVVIPDVDYKDIDIPGRL